MILDKFWYAHFYMGTFKFVHLFFTSTFILHFSYFIFTFFTFHFYIFHVSFLHFSRFIFTFTLILGIATFTIHMAIMIQCYLVFGFRAALLLH